jgi:hypothetical protein
MVRRTLVAATFAALCLTTAAEASAPPVGPLPKGPVTTIAAQHGTLVSVALPKRSGGKVWRLARAVDPKVLQEVTEGDIGSTVVIVYKAVAPGTATIVYGLTRGETKKAYASATFKVRVS